MKEDRSIQQALGLPLDETIHAVIAPGYSEDVYQRTTGRKKVVTRYCEG